MSRRRYTLDGRLGQLYVRGATLKADVAPLVTKATLSLSSGEVSELKLDVADDEEFRLLRSRLFEPGTTRTAGSPVDYLGLKLECRAVEVRPRGEDATVTVTARSLGAGKLKRQTGALVRRNLSPTQFAHLKASAAGLRFVGEPSPKRPTVTRTKDESSWDTIQRLADELGYVAFEVAGTLYFGRPTYLVQHTPRVPVAWAGDNVGRRSDDAVLSLPVCRRTGDNARRIATVDLELLGELGDRVLPGMALDLTGVPTFDGRYMVTAVTIELDDEAPVTVTAETPVNPEPQPPEDPKDASGSSSSSKVKTPRAGSYGGTRFTSEQLRNATAIYRYGRAVKGASERDLVVALATAMQESSLRNLKGGDRDSAGLFQQRPSAGWGSHSQVTNIKYATETFLKGVGRNKGLLDYPHRASWSVAKAAQTVQRSAHPSAYARWETEARAIIRAIKSASAAASSSSSSSGSTSGHKSAGAFVALCLEQAGDRYVYGAEARLSDRDPDAFDCSELVQWALHRVGVTFPDGSSNQRRKAKRISVAQARKTRGALLFRPGHVAVSLGDGRTIEAKGRKYGVLVDKVGNRFTSGGLVPGLRY